MPCGTPRSKRPLVVACNHKLRRVHHREHQHTCTYPGESLPTGCAQVCSRQRRRCKVQLEAADVYAVTAAEQAPE